MSEDLTDLILDSNEEKTTYRSPYYTLHRGAPQSRVEMVEERAKNALLSLLEGKKVEADEDAIEFVSRESLSRGMIDYYAQYSA